MQQILGAMSALERQGPRGPFMGLTEGRMGREVGAKMLGMDLEWIWKWEIQVEMDHPNVVHGQWLSILVPPIQPFLSNRSVVAFSMSYDRMKFMALAAEDGVRFV